jgi:hypothetical protein
MANRDPWFAQVVKDEVLAKRRVSIEPELQAAGAKTYLIVTGTNTRRL